MCSAVTDDQIATDDRCREDIDCRSRDYLSVRRWALVARADACSLLFYSLSRTMQISGMRRAAITRRDSHVNSSLEKSIVLGARCGAGDRILSRYYAWQECCP
jgi:hypothetical protein